MGGLIFVLTLFLFSSANALTLKEAEELAVKNYPELKALELQSESLAFKLISPNLLSFIDFAFILLLSDWSSKVLSSG